MKACRVLLFSVITAVLAGCAVVPYQSAYYVRPVYVARPVVYSQPFVIATWHQEHYHHGYY